MIIKSLHLENYRCFENFDIGFDDRLTVLVGVNGAGKTATLDALSVFLKQAGHPENKNNQTYYLSTSDIAIGRNPEDIRYFLEARQRSITAETVAMSLIYHATHYGSIYIGPEKHVEAIQRVLNNETVLCAAYMAGRFIRDEESVLKNSIYTPSAFSAFENSFNRNIDYSSTVAWFNNADADEARNMRDNGTKDELPELRAVREALSQALLGQYEKPRMLGNPPELIVHKKGTDVAYKVSQLSDGYRAMLALVMDLARRMAQVISNKDDSCGSLLNTPAIVLIDEVELHLHPSWQQTVLNTLQEIFPNTQFIVTTHSPQVLTSIPSKHIRILSDGKAYTYNEQSEGAEASRLLNRVFGVETRPFSLGIVQALRKYQNMVYAEQWDTPEAEALRKRLTEHFGYEEPLLMELDLHIENVKWERGL